jgi:hypothetical protein
MKLFRNTAVVLFALALMAPAAFAAEQIDNPMYAQWKKYKPGTWVTTKTVADFGGNKSETETTTKLIEITPEKAVIEMTSVMSFGGQKLPPQPGTKMDVPAKVNKPDAAATGDQPKPDVKESSEDVTVSGKTLKCKVTETTTKGPAGEMTAKVWQSDEVPGSVVKMETKMAQGSSKSELVGFEVK